ncbi:hypothetical protein VTH82DRAFT_8497 [Thermothelomyces myriococcoides]
MKYGEHFEKESVPQWSLHNIDYNSLKHHIKAHTTRDQATAITIPGRPNTALTKFEDDFYAELCRQHDRVDLFVSSKADEISRRLQHLSTQIHRLIVRCATSGQEQMPLKRRQRFAKYEQNLLQCGEDIRALHRFVSAQVVAFRKIIKKYRKWTGSVTLGARFKENVLSHPKSFTKRDFSQLQARYEDLLQTLRAALPAGGISLPRQESSRPSRSRLSPAERAAASEEAQQQQPTGYWNEYECGSEGGDFDRNGDEYAIYIDPNQDTGFPGLQALGAFFAKSTRKLGSWVPPKRKGDPPTIATEHESLLGDHQPSVTGYGSTTIHSVSSGRSSPPGGTNTFSTTGTAAGTDTDVEDQRGSPPPPHRGTLSRQYTSSSSLDEPFSSRPGTREEAEEEEEEEEGAEACYDVEAGGLPGTMTAGDRRRMAQYREHVLAWATWGCFGAAFVLMDLAAVLIATGRHKMRLEVDAGVTLGIVTSLGLACGGLSMTSARTGTPNLLGRLAVWLAFAVVCVGDGILLVLVMGNTR